MVVKIRLARFGRKRAPVYNIVVAQARSARDSRPLEVLGTFDPIRKNAIDGQMDNKPWKDVKLDLERARYWVGVGAQPSDPVWRLLAMAGILEPKYRPNALTATKPRIIPHPNGTPRPRKNVSASILAKEAAEFEAGRQILYVENIPLDVTKHLTEERLIKPFSTLTGYISARLATWNTPDKWAENRFGTGFVEFESKRLAVEATKLMHGYKVPELQYESEYKTLRVRDAKEEDNYHELFSIQREETRVRGFNERSDPQMVMPAGDDRW